MRPAHEVDRVGAGTPIRSDRGLVHVVDDDLSVREAVSSLLRSMGLRVQTYESALEFLGRPAAPDEGPACLILDVRMPGLNGLDLQRHLAREPLALPIVFITGHGDIPMTVRAMKAGAVEFLPKPFRDQDLLEAIDTALARSRTQWQEREATRDLRARFDTLTPREREVLGLLVRGLRNRQMAEQLHISEVTVKVHRHNLMDKMQASTVPMLIGMLESLRPALGEMAPTEGAAQGLSRRESTKFDAK